MRADLKLTEIAELTGVSRPTLYSLQRRRAHDDPELLLFDVLASLATAGPLSEEQLAGELGLTRNEGRHLLEDLGERGLIAPAMTEYESDTRMTHYRLTPDGDRELEWLTSSLREQIDASWAVYVQVAPQERAELTAVAASAFGQQRFALIEPSVTNITGSVKDTELAFHVRAPSPRDAGQRATAQLARLRELGGLKARIDRTVLVLADD